MSTYTPPALNAVDFALTAHTVPSIASPTQALSPYSVPSLTAANFSLIAYTQPTYQDIGWELLPTSGGAITGALATTDGTDTAAFVGDVCHVGALVVIEAGDICVAEGDVDHDGAIAASEGSDVATFDGSTYPLLWFYRSDAPVGLCRRVSPKLVLHDEDHGLYWVPAPKQGIGVRVQ